MKSICFYFQVHQPFRLRTYRFFDIGENHFYFDEYRNKYIIQRVAEKCYLPMNQVLLDTIKEYGSAFKVSFSISGTALEQFKQYCPEVLDSFRKLAETGCVEFLAETYSHSLASLRSKKEFFDQVNMQKNMVKELLNYSPKTFRNTELIYSDGIGEMAAELGFNTILTEGAKHVLGWKSPNFMYCNAINPKMKVLLKNFRLSDDIAFRFSQHSWDEWPLTTEKYVDWLNSESNNAETVNLFMDYETFGEHQWPETGIFEFMKVLPGRVFSHSQFKFYTPSELSKNLQPVAPIHVHHPISWADEERDLTAWLGNELQDDAFAKIYDIEEQVKMSDNEELIRDWRYMQTSDHFYYMCTKWFSDGDVHKYFNPYNSPYEAYVNFMNIYSDFLIRLGEKTEQYYDIPVDTKATANKDVKAAKLKKNKPASKKVAPVKNKKTTTEIAPKLKKKITVNSLSEPDFNSIIIEISNVKLKKVLAELDAFTVGLALCGSDKKTRDKIISNAGIRFNKKLEEMAITSSEIRPKDIERCRKIVLAKIKKIK